MATLTVSDSYGLDMSDFDFSSLFYADSYTRTSTTFTANYGSWADQFRGSGFRYDSGGVPTAGTVSSYAILYNGSRMAEVSGISIAVTTIVEAAKTDWTYDDEAIIQNALRGNDVIKGGDLTNFLWGYAGDDKIHGGESWDQLHGGDGNDTLHGGADYDDLWGDNGNDTLYGGTYGDSLAGGDGNDTLIGGEGQDDLNGGAGSDTASYADATEGVFTSLIDGGTHQFDDAYMDRYTFIENLTGSSFADQLYGDTGNNVLSGEKGDDRLFGDYGNDTLVGGAGADWIYGGRGADTASYANASTGVVASLVNPSSNTNDAAGDSYDLIENLLGSRYVDVLIGNHVDNTLNGGDGNDNLLGGAGADKLYGGNGIDSASYAKATAGVVVNIGNTSVNVGEAVGDIYSSIENLIGSSYADQLHGSTEANSLVGGGGNDLLSGNRGNDWIYGGAGTDRLYGGAHADRFVFKALSESAGATFDTIFDFLPSEQDRIDLSAIDAGTTSAGNQAFSFVGTAAFKGVAGELRYEKLASDTYIYADVNGDKVADLKIHLDDAVTLTKDYFLL
ncbi:MULTISPECIES: calcium-binding protein [Sinorhizobium]|uniref:calcium-binding protein n=1 Tax=Sinorhizobium TaxID=28105 RepID=UPI00114178FB|nr:MULTISPECIES: calcium-binding protein [Sinorhizobium]